MRRLIGGPFSRKFLFDQVDIFKDCVKRLLDDIERLRGENDERVEVLMEFRKYALDVVSTCLGSAFIHYKLNFHMEDISRSNHRV